MHFWPKKEDPRASLRFPAPTPAFSRRLALLGLCLSSFVATAQEATPNAPIPQTDLAFMPTSPSDNVLPDAPAPTAASLPVPAQPLSNRGKLSFATKNAFGAPSLLFAAVGAANNQAQGLYPEFHGGLDGYGRYYWHSFADQAVDSYIVSFVMASAMHIDPRYQPLRSGGAMRRTGHAVASLFYAQTDAGQRTINTPQLLGSGVAASLSSLYYPERDRTASLVLQRWGGNLAGDGLIIVLREFTPEFSHLGRSLCDGFSFCSKLRRNTHSSDPWQQDGH